MQKHEAERLLAHFDDKFLDGYEGSNWSWGSCICEYPPGSGNWVVLYVEGEGPVFTRNRVDAVIVPNHNAVREFNFRHDGWYNDVADALRLEGVFDLHTWFADEYPEYSQSDARDDRVEEIDERYPVFEIDPTKLGLEETLSAFLSWADDADEDDDD